jgi:hypothetical protein
VWIGAFWHYVMRRGRTVWRNSPHGTVSSPNARRQAGSPRIGSWHVTILLLGESLRPYCLERSARKAERALVSRPDERSEEISSSDWNRPWDGVTLRYGIGKKSRRQFRQRLAEKTGLLVIARWCQHRRPKDPIDGTAIPAG